MRWWGGLPAQRMRRLVLERDGYVCHLCGLPGASTVDHLVPQSRGGTHEESNLAAAHRRCNYSRGNRPVPSKLDERARW